MPLKQNITVEYEQRTKVLTNGHISHSYDTVVTMQQLSVPFNPPTLLSLLSFISIMDDAEYITPPDIIALLS